MKVCGFTFIRNAIKYDYPVEEALQSILPICDKVIVVVGASEDNTKNLIERIDPGKIIIVDSVWDEKLKEGGRVLADETNKAIDVLPENYDWAFYIQGDEVVHEKYYPAIAESMQRWKDDKRVEGLLFDYVHFYGSYEFVGDSTRWYRNEIRIIRPDHSIRSFRDAQGFRKEGRMLNVKPANASIYHYGWVKSPVIQQQKQKYFHSLWHDEEWIKNKVAEGPEFDYSKIDSLNPFNGTHPSVMKGRINVSDWKFSFDPSAKRMALKSRLKLFVEKLTGWRPGEYRNYKLLKD